MGSSFENGSLRANTSPQDIDLLHEIAPGLDYSHSLKYGSSASQNFGNQTNPLNFMACCETKASHSKLISGL